MKRYQEKLEGLKDISLLEEPDNCKSNFWLITLRFNCNSSEIARARRLSLLDKSHSKGLLLRPVWKLLNMHPMYKNSPSGNLVVANDQSNRLLSLPSSPQLLSI